MCLASSKGFLLVSSENPMSETPLLSPFSQIRKSKHKEVKLSKVVGFVRGRARDLNPGRSASEPSGIVTSTLLLPVTQVDARKVELSEP